MAKSKITDDPDNSISDNNALVPEHIAIIMDGNRRWAKNRNLPVATGHKKGEEAFHKIVETCKKIGVKVLTAYAFSVENWKRSSEEVGVLMRLFEFYLEQEKKYLIKNNIRLKIIGISEGLPISLQKAFKKVEKETEHFTEMTLNLAVNYGSRTEITAAVQKIADDVHNGRLKSEEINEKLFSEYLTTAGQKDPDLLIRTSGEIRLSNFLLWQSAYTEFYFTDTLWPDFTPENLMEAIKEYQKRSRRFGGS